MNPFFAQNSDFVARTAEIFANKRKKYKVQIQTNDDFRGTFV